MTNHEEASGEKSLISTKFSELQSELTESKKNYKLQSNNFEKLRREAAQLKKENQDNSKQHSITFKKTQIPAN